MTTTNVYGLYMDADDYDRNAWNNDYTDSNNISLESLWDKMYLHPKPVIIVCGYCKSHNVISSPTCVQCGAPMGYGKERV